MNLILMKFLLLLFAAFTVSCCDNGRIRSEPKKFQSKNFPDHVIGFNSEKLPAIAAASDEAFRIVRPGISGTPGTISLESVKFPGHYLRHRDYLLHLDTFEEEEVFRKDSTFWLRHVENFPGFHSFESSNFPGYYIRHQGYRLKLNKDDGETLFKKDSSFRILDYSGTVRSAPKELRSKNFQAYVIGFDGDNLPSISPNSHKTFRVVSPGISGKPGTVSLESVEFPGFYLRHRNYLLHLDSYQPSAVYFEDATFWMRQNYYFDGYCTFESTNFPGYYVRHQNYRLKIARYDESLLFKDDSSFTMSTVFANENSCPKELHSKNFPAYQIGYDNNNLPSIVTNTVEGFQIVSPGLTGTSGTVSIKSLYFPGHYLRHSGFFLHLHPYEESDVYFKDATFRKREDEYFSGYDAFESVNFPGYFIRHQNYRLRISPNDQTDLFKADASFKCTPRLFS